MANSSPACVGALLVGGLLAAAIGCAGPETVSVRTVNQYGKRTIKAPYANVFKAGKDALENLGYVAVSAEISTGRIASNRRELERIVGEDGKYHKLERQYVIRMSKVRDEIQVVAEPHLFVDGAEQKYHFEIWDLGKEKELWDLYFAELMKLLVYD